MAQSSFPSGIPCAAASSGARPVKYFSGSYPNKLKLATSEPAGSESGTLLALPTTPATAMASIFGVLAACKWVLPPKDS